MKMANGKWQMANGRGFTLVELLVTVVLMSILMLSSVMVFSSYTKSQTFQTGVKDITSILNKAKSRSISQVKPTICGTNTLDGYRLVFTPSGNDYKLQVLCGGSTHDVESGKLPSQVTFTDISAMMKVGIPKQ